jgi:hypothetical protein
MSMFSVGSVMSKGSALSCQSDWSLMSFQSSGGVMGSRTDGPLRKVGPPVVLAGIATGALLGYLHWRRTR